MLFCGQMHVKANLFEPGSFWEKWAQVIIVRDLGDLWCTLQPTVLNQIIWRPFTKSFKIDYNKSSSLVTNFELWQFLEISSNPILPQTFTFLNQSKKYL